MSVVNGDESAGQKGRRLAPRRSARVRGAFAVRSGRMIGLQHAPSDVIFDVSQCHSPRVLQVTGDVGERRPCATSAVSGAPEIPKRRL